MVNSSAGRTALAGTGHYHHHHHHHHLQPQPTGNLLHHHHYLHHFNHSSVYYRGRAHPQRRHNIHHHLADKTSYYHHNHHHHRGQSPSSPPPPSSPSSSNRPLYRRVYNFIRQAWTGVKFSLDSEFDDLETPPRYRPESVQYFCRTTGFTESEIKKIYRNFKTECPTGLIKEDAFRGIYSQFFPQGANISQYAHYVFQSLDHERNGILNFEDMVQGLWTLSRGSVDDKLRWAFTLYDLDGDGQICRDEMTRVVTAIYELMGKFAEPWLKDGTTVAAHVDFVFQKMDLNRDGVVSFDEFMETCKNDENITRAMISM
ncbi:Kv channel-interacting protein 1-like [Rhopalosiphum padi]|uniref:Kv channel-interacting protein 1-like n=1 Tax=Rhopalosiphum padi TaxID=40932 RepID=UPI00298E6158|nr:Kv channel-interacting protein 1-like [Rhopalosiphum padi]XP_060854410.1 Kv channel-interacting protein 1-like [Rhopalosiphum padi]